MIKPEFLKEMVKLAAAYPHFAPAELTWEVYWQDLCFIPMKYLLEGITECRLTKKFFPTVSEIVQASIGNNYSVVPCNPNKPTTIEDIIRRYQLRYQRAQLQIEGNEPKQVTEDKINA